MLSFSDKTKSLLGGAGVPPIDPAAGTVVAIKPKGILAGVAGAAGEGDDPKKPKEGNRLTFSQLKEWNDVMKSNPKGSLQEILEAYKKKNPNTKITYEALQNEFAKQKAFDVASAQRNRDMAGNDANSGFMFPHLKGFDGKDLGPMNGDGQVEGQQKVKLPDGYTNEVPEGVDMILDNQYASFEDPKTGDLRWTSRDNFYKKYPRLEGESDKAYIERMKKLGAYASK